jgi:hypothetical protein
MGRKPAADQCATPSRRACKVIADFAMLLDAARDADAFDRNALILPGDRSTAVAGRVAEIPAARIGNARLQTIGPDMWRPSPIPNRSRPQFCAIFAALVLTGSGRHAARAPRMNFQRTGETSW